MKPGRFFVLVTLGLAVATAPLRADKIPALSQVSPLLPASDQSSFLERRGKIQKRVRDFKEASEGFNKKPAALQSDKEFDDLTKERAKCVTAVEEFNLQIIARMKALEAGDTSVVDARDVPSGLSPEIDTALAGAFASAPPGVGDRVRKGLQAVMAHDWQVAKAWFEDALHRDPGNAALTSLLVAVQSDPAAAAAKEKAEIVDLYRRGYDAVAAGDRTGAITAFEMAMKRDSNPGSIGTLVNYLKTKPAVAPAMTPQLPAVSDMDFLHDVQGASPAPPPQPPTLVIGKDGQPLEVPPTSKQDSPLFIKGRNGELLQLPRDSDHLFPDPDSEPPATGGDRATAPFLKLLLDALKAPPKNPHPQVGAVRG